MIWEEALHTSQSIVKTLVLHGAKGAWAVPVEVCGSTRLKMRVRLLCEGTGLPSRRSGQKEDEILVPFEAVVPMDDADPRIVWTFATSRALGYGPGWHVEFNREAA